MVTRTYTGISYIWPRLLLGTNTAYKLMHIYMYIYIFARSQTFCTFPLSGEGWRTCHTSALLQYVAQREIQNINDLVNNDRD